MQRKILSVAAAVIFAVTATVTVYAESAKSCVILKIPIKAESEYRLSVLFLLRRIRELCFFLKTKKNTDR